MCWKFSYNLPSTRQQRYNHSTGVVTQTSNTHCMFQLSRDKNRLAGRSTALRASAQLVNNVKHHRQMVFRMACESTVLQLQTSTSGGPYLRVRWWEALKLDTTILASRSESRSDKSCVFWSRSVSSRIMFTSPSHRSAQTTQTEQQIAFQR